MTSIDTQGTPQLNTAVETAVTNAGGGGQLNPGDIDKILAVIDQEIGKDLVTLTELRAIDSTLARLTRAGKLTPQRAEAFREQLSGAINRAVDNQQMRATASARQWLTFAGGLGQESSLRQMAEQAATSRNGRFGWLSGQRVTADEVKQMLETASRDGQITLSEVNAMYQGVHDAFQNGQISRTEHNQAISELDRQLKGQAGQSRRGGCARRAKGPYADKLTPEAKDFVENALGGRMGRSKTKGWTTWRFDRPKVQKYVGAICTDGVVTGAERQALMNLLLRDGRVTTAELQCVRQSLAWAARRGDISQEEYQRTVRIFEAEVAKLSGGARADSLQQEMALRRNGMFIIPG